MYNPAYKWSTFSDLFNFLMFRKGCLGWHHSKSVTEQVSLMKLYFPLNFKLYHLLVNNTATWNLGIARRLEVVVACMTNLSSGAMGDKLGTLFPCNLNLTTGNARPCYGSAHQVPVLIDCIGLNWRPDEVLHKLFAQVFNENLQSRCVLLPFTKRASWAEIGR